MKKGSPRTYTVWYLTMIINYVNDLFMWAVQKGWKFNMRDIYKQIICLAVASVIFKVKLFKNFGRAQERAVVSAQPAWAVAGTLPKPASARQQASSRCRSAEAAAIRCYRRRSGTRCILETRSKKRWSGGKVRPGTNDGTRDWLDGRARNENLFILTFCAPSFDWVAVLSPDGSQLFDGGPVKVAVLAS